MKPFRPMLAATPKNQDKWPLDKFPYIASPKIDGVRCVVRDGVALTRTLIPVPNRFTQNKFGKWALNNLDGELAVGDYAHPKCMQATSSGVMSFDGEPQVGFYVFDFVPQVEGMPYVERIELLSESRDFLAEHGVTLLEHKVINNEQELWEYEAQCVARGFEGTMLRSLNGPYKFGRSTEREGYLIKLKRFEDFEALIVGFYEQMHNANSATIDERGLTKRSTHAENKIPMDTLGGFVLLLPDGTQFDCGTGEGLTADIRKYIWTHREQYLYKFVVCKKQPHGEKDKPRIPIFKGFRDARDIC